MWVMQIMFLVLVTHLWLHSFNFDSVQKKLIKIWKGGFCVYYNNQNCIMLRCNDNIFCEILFFNDNSYFNIYLGII